ncbi:membrane protein [Vibrio ishigakensis]|uniref:Membrane protein n=1 Tax=Vibrio ishigakensis TaxID=1481914 RepID=A0A0B8P3E8_9VIBR|nr:membrane protein [Vibrio ishigakensis]
MLHAGSTLSSFGKYLDPFNNLLFFTAWPMLAACFVLYLLQDYDTLVLGKSRKPAMV